MHGPLNVKKKPNFMYYVSWPTHETCVLQVNTR